MWDIASASVIFLSVVITLVEACFISQTRFRMFANAAQAVFAAIFCSQWGYNLYNFLFNTAEDDRDVEITEKVKLFFLTGQNAFWNAFDGILNVVSILDIFVDTWEGRFVHGLAAMRVARAFALFRIFASNKHLKDLRRVMHTALIQMLQFGIVILASLVLASVVATNMLWDFPDEQVADSYSDLGTTMWTLFKISTMDGWTEAIRPCLELHPSLLYFYAIFVFFSLSSISIVPAIFIELVMEEREKRKAQKHRRRERHRRRAKKAIQRAISLRHVKQPELSSDDSSCHSSSVSSSSHSDRFAVVNELSQSLHSLLLELRGEDSEGDRGRSRGLLESGRGPVRPEYRRQVVLDSERDHRYNSIPSTEDLDEIAPLQESQAILKIARDVGSLQDDMQNLRLLLLERFDILQHEVLRRLVAPKVAFPMLNKTDPSEQEEQASFSGSSFQREVTTNSLQTSHQNDPPEKGKDGQESEISPEALEAIPVQDDNDRSDSSRLTMDQRSPQYAGGVVGRIEDDCAKSLGER